MTRTLRAGIVLATLAVLASVPGVAQAVTPAYPGLTGGGTVAAPVQVATGIGSNFDITDTTGVGWSSVTATVTTNRGTLTADTGDSGATVGVASNTITIEGSIVDVEKVLNSQGTAFTRLTQGSDGSATVTVTVNPSPEFTIGGTTTYFFSGNGHYYRINTSLRDWTQVNSDAQGTTVAGAPGYVGVVQTQAEDDFLRGTVLPDVTGPDVSARQVWLGADRGSTNLSDFGCSSPTDVLTTAFTWVPGTNAPVGDRNVNVSPACAAAQTNLAWKPWYPGEPTNSGLEVRLAYFDIGTWAWHDSNQSTAQSLQEFGSNTTYTAASTTFTVTASDPPYNTARPTISGTVAVGQTLTADKGTWTGSPTIADPGGYTYQWQQCTSQVGVPTTFASLAGTFPEYVRLDPSDNVFSGNRDTNNISKLTPAGIAVDSSGATVTSPFTWATAGSGPFGMALDSAGNVYVANRNTTTITKADIRGATTTLTSAARPANVAVDSNGNVYAANFEDDSVSKFLPGATTPTQTFTAANGVNFDEPFGMAFDSSDNLYLVDRGNNRVVKITPAGVASAFGQIGTGGDRLGIAVDAGGNVYVGSGTNPGQVRKLLPDGTQAGGNWPVPIADPQDVAIGPDGNIYVSRGPSPYPDPGTVTPIVAGDIFRITPDGIATDIGKTGVWPLGISFDAAGNIYAADRYTSTITKVTTMTCSDIAGATAANYTLQAGDAGKQLRVKVTAANGVSPSSSAYSAITTGPKEIGVPAISGTTAVGQTLTTSRGLWSASPAIPDPAGYSYRWQRCESDAVAGDTWVSQTTNANGWYGLTWGGPSGGEKFVAVAFSGDANRAMTSPDGVTWTTHATPGGTGSKWASVTWGGPPGNEKFVAVGGVDGGNRVMTSPDGINWTAQSAPDGRWFSVTWGGQPGSEKFVAVADGGDDRVMTSTDGITWVAQDSVDDGSTWYGVTWGGPAGGERFVAVAGVPGPSGHQVMTSPDGTTWTAKSAPVANGWLDVTWGGPVGQETFVAVSYNGSGNQVMTSSNGDTWTIRSTPVTSNFNAVAWGGIPGQETFVTVADYNGAATSTGMVMTSPDGITWTGKDASAYNQWRAIAWGGPAGNERFAAVAYLGGATDRAMTSAGPGCVDIGSATSSTYTAQPADYQKYIRSEITADNGVDPDGVAYSAISSQIAGQAPTNAGGADLPTITGTATVGSTLTATDGTWTATPAITGYSYQWRRCDAAGANCADISGATNQTYVLVSADADSTIRVQVTATNGVSPDGEATSAQTAAVTEAPSNTTAPSISGTARVGQTLTTTNGVWSATPAVTGYSYQWQRCDGAGANCTNVGTDQNTYTLVSADAGSTIRAQVTATNGVTPDGSATSVATSAVTEAPSNTTAPTISGTATVGQTLTTTNGVWSATPAVPDPSGYSYQWQRCDAGGTNCADIGGATSSTYTLQADDYSKYVRSRVTANNGVSPNGVASSPVSTQIAGIAPTNAGGADLPVISGTVAVGNTLTASDGTWTATPAVSSYSYQWRRCDASGANCADISGATNQTYVVASADIGTTLRVQVTAANGVSPNGVATSTQTAVVASTLRNDAIPTITGTGQVGQILTTTDGTWTASPAITGYAYQWQRCNQGAPVSSIFGTTGSSPRGIALDSAGNVYITNQSSNSVTKITAGGTATTPFSATGTFPWGIAVDSAGNVYTANSADNNVTKITPGGSSTILGATGTSPSAIAVDSAGNVYTANADSNTVTKITSGGTATTLGTTGAAPFAIAVDPAGNIYTANSDSNTVTKITPAGVSTTLGTTGSSPLAITVDSAGNVYTANSGSNTVTKITPAGTSTTLGTTGSSPRGIALDSAGNVYTANHNSNNVTKITPAGTSTTLGTTGSSPSAIALDSVGNVYTANSGSDNVTRIGIDCSDIAGATSQTYTLQTPDAAKYLRSIVTATNAGGSLSVPSSPTAEIAPEPETAPTSSGTVPPIGGTAAVGSSLTAAPGTWNGNPTPTFTYRWQRCDADGTNCVDIAGATNSTYILTTDDTGKRIQAVITATNTVGSAVVVSPQTDVVSGPPANQALPTITGTPQENETLTADPGAWIASPAISGYSYQWRRCDAAGANCTDIGTNQNTYTLVAADNGTRIRVLVTATNTVRSANATSDPTTAVIPLQAPTNTGGIPPLTGPATVGSTLTAAPGTWTGTPTPTITYQWQRCDADGTNCTPISGQTGQTYELTAADTGKKIQVAVTGTNTAGSGGTPSSAVVESPATAVISGPPVNQALPIITGTFQEKETLTAGPGAWIASPAPTFAYQWQRCDSAGGNCAPISGATGVTYTLTAEDTGKRIRVVSTATNSAGSASATSDPTGVVAPEPQTAPINAGGSLPIDGTAEVGQTLTATDGTWDANPAPTFTYQWLRCDANGDNCTPITGANGQTYIPTGADDDATLRVVVTATNSIGSGSRISSPTAPVVPASTSAPTNTTLPSISGTAKVGQTLTATSGTWSAAPAVPDPSGYAYQWQRCEDAAGTNCSDIAGATNSTYTLGAADLDTYLRVRVTASNGVAPDGVAFSAPSARVASADPTPPPAPGVAITSMKAVKNSRIVVRVQVDQPGTIRLAGSYTLGATRTRVRACVMTRTVTRPGIHRMSCPLNARTRARLASGSLRITVRATVTTDSGQSATTTRTMRVKRYAPKPRPVTG